MCIVWLPLLFLTFSMTHEMRLLNLYYASYYPKNFDGPKTNFHLFFSLVLQNKNKWYESASEVKKSKVKLNMDRSPGGASPSSMNLSTFLGGSSPSPGGGGGASGSASNFYANFANQASPSTTSQQYSTSMSIRHEIQRFESVHPSIYAIYDLIELIPDQLLSQQIREHVVCIEGKTENFFVNA